MDFMTIVSRMLSLFLIMVVGYVMRKTNVIDEEAPKRYTKLVLNISLPAQIITSFLAGVGVVSNGEVFFVFGISAAVYLLYGLAGIIFLVVTRAPKKQRGTYMFMSLFPNIGFMGFPVILAIFGEEAMIYTVIMNVVFNIVVYSLGVALIDSDKNGFHFNLRLLLNIPLCAALLSIVLFFLGISLPETVDSALTYLGNITTPVAMLILGATIAQMPVKELFDDWRVYVFTAVRLLLIPGLVLAATRMVLPAESHLLRGTLVILAAMPVATNTTMLAIEYHGDTSLASKGIFFSTLLSVVTIPVIAMMC